MIGFVIGACTLSLILVLMVVKYASRAHHWELIARGEIQTEAAHAVCLRQINDLEQKVSTYKRAFETEKKNNEKLEKLFKEKVQPVVNKAAEELASWIAEEESELAAKDKA
jgi:predicted Holliday junction resolvase-like endonuclease